MVLVLFMHVIPVGKTVFSQLMSLVLEYEFRKCIDKCNGDFHTVDFTCREQFLVLNFAQLTDRVACIIWLIVLRMLNISLQALLFIQVPQVQKMLK